MNLRTPLLAALLCLPLAACGDRPQNADPAIDTTIGQKVREVTDKAQKKMAEGNLGISKDGGPKVEISPTGDLLIDDVAVPLDANQRALVLQYRGQMMEVIKAGIDVGVQGANLGAQAAGEAIKGIFSGDTGKIEARVNAEAEKIKQSAAKICDLLPGLMTTQQQMAAAIPQFKPYATMDQSDIDDCRNNGEFSAP